VFVTVSQYFNLRATFFHNYIAHLSFTERWARTKCHILSRPGERRGEGQKKGKGKKQRGRTGKGGRVEEEV